MSIRPTKLKPTAWYGKFTGRLTRQLTRFKSESGAIVVEFALIAPILFSMTFGIVEFGRAAFTQGVLLYAAEEATRYAIVNYDATTDQVKAVAESKFLLIDPAKITSFSVTAPIDPDDQTRLITVSLAYQFDFLLPISSITLTSNSKGFITEDI